MKNKYISFFLIILGLLIVGVIAIEYVNSKPKKAKQNPYEYNVDEFKQVDSLLVSHFEKRRIKVKLNGRAGLTTFDGKIYLAANSTLTVISPEGKLLSSFSASADTRAIIVNANNIAIAEKNQVSVFDHAGNLNYSTPAVSDSSVFTSVAFWDGDIVVADAGKRRIYIFEKEKLVTEIEGISGIQNLHGFIIPSARFDLAVNNENELWVVNPGMHALQQYTRRGALAGSWNKASLTIEGFSGCCNPAQICTLSDERIVTSEKNIPRIKIYSRNGELLSVVAPPTVFGSNIEASEVAAIGETIIALDIEQQLIRIFEKNMDKKNE